MGSVFYQRHFYKVVKALKSYCVYELERVEGSQPYFTSTLRIEKFNGYSKSKGIGLYLRLRTTNNWKTCELVTGLRASGRALLYEGNQLKNKKKSLLLFEFTPQPQKLVLDVFPGFYPHNKAMLKKIIEQHPSGL